MTAARFTNRAFAGVFVDDRVDLDRSAVGGGIELKSTAHTRFGASACRGVRCGGDAGAFTSAASRHPQPFLAPQPLNLPVIHAPTLTPSIVIGAAETPPWMDFRIAAEPFTQPGVGIGRRRVDALVALTASVLPVHAAGEPLTDTHHLHEVVNGCPPAFRA